MDRFAVCATAKVPLKYKDFGGFGASGCCVVLDHWVESTLRMQTYDNAPV